MTNLLIALKQQRPKALIVFGNVAIGLEIQFLQEPPRYAVSAGFPCSASGSVAAKSR